MLMTRFIGFIIFLHLSLSDGFFWGQRRKSSLFSETFNIYHLKGDSFYETIWNTTIPYEGTNKSYVWFVDFYAPWCPHCRHFAPAFEELADHYAAAAIQTTSRSFVKFATIDCTRDRAVCTVEGVTGYPGLKLYNAATRPVVQPISSSRDADGLCTWIENELEANGFETATDLGLPSQRRSAGNPRIIPEFVTAAERHRRARASRLLDAATAFLIGIERSMFMGKGILAGERYNAAVEWILIVSKIFPLESNKLALEKLLEAVTVNTSWERLEWKKMVQEWKKQSFEQMGPQPADLFTRELNDWHVCSTYPCGLWTLFHILAANVENEATINPDRVTKAIRNFVKFFFGCEECVKHFLQARPPENNSSESLSFWLWDMHNAVNKWLNRPLWPMVSECSTCYPLGSNITTASNVSFDKDVAYKYIMSAFEMQDTTHIALDDPVENNLRPLVNPESFMSPNRIAFVLFFFAIGIVGAIIKSKSTQRPHLA